MASPIKILELRSVRGTGGGPEKTILMGAARSDARHTRVTVTYIRDTRDPVFGIDGWAARLGVDYAEVRERHSFDPAIWRQLRALVRERQITIVHAHDYKTNVLALLLARRTGVIPVATEHGWTGHSRRERRLYYPADKRLARFFPKVLAVSEEIRQELLRHGARPERVETILNGIDAHAFRRDPARRESVRFALGLAPDDVVVGSVGRLEPQKRFDLLMAAVASLMPSFPSLRLVIAGDGSDRDWLAGLRQKMALGDRCVFLGHRTDVAELHHAFDLYVQSSDYEGTPNAVLEAMAMSTPIVATDAGGTREIARHGEHALIVPAGNTVALADAITEVLGDPRAAARRTAAARARVETTLSFDARTRRLEAIYGELTRAASARPGSPTIAA